MGFCVHAGDEPPIPGRPDRSLGTRGGRSPDPGEAGPGPPLPTVSKARGQPGPEARPALGRTGGLPAGNRPPVARRQGLPNVVPHRQSGRGPERAVPQPLRRVPGRRPLDQAGPGHRPISRFGSQQHLPRPDAGEPHPAGDPHPLGPGPREGVQAGLLRLRPHRSPSPGQRLLRGLVQGRHPLEPDSGRTPVRRPRRRGQLRLGPPRAPLSGLRQDLRAQRRTPAAGHRPDRHH